MYSVTSQEQGEAFPYMMKPGTITAAQLGRLFHALKGSRHIGISEPMYLPAMRVTISRQTAVSGNTLTTSQKVSLVMTPSVVPVPVLTVTC